MEYGISGYRSEHNRYENKQVIQIDHVQADLNGRGDVVQIYLLGIKEEDHLILDDITVVVDYQNTNERQYYALPISRGMGGGLHVQDFNHDGQKDIGIYIQTGGTGNQLGYWILFNNYDSFSLGFSSEAFEDKMKYSVIYQPNYEVEVTHLPSGQKKTLNIQDKGPTYLQSIYASSGELKAPIKGAVASVSDSDPIESKVHDIGHDLIFYQRILGRSHNDTLGYVQSYLMFDQDQFHVYKILISQS